METHQVILTAQFVGKETLTNGFPENVIDKATVEVEKIRAGLQRNADKLGLDMKFTVSNTLTPIGVGKNVNKNRK